MNGVADRCENCFKAHTTEQPYPKGETMITEGRLLFYVVLQVGTFPMVDKMIGLGIIRFLMNDVTNAASGENKICYMCRIEGDARAFFVAVVSIVSARMKSRHKSGYLSRPASSPRLVLYEQPRLRQRVLYA